MKKNKLFLVLVGLLAVCSAIAQQNPTWKTNRMTTWKIQYLANEETQTIDSIGEENLYRNSYYYDKSGNLISNITYNAADNTIREQYAYTYNEHNKVLSESCISSYNNYQTDYEYDDTGLKLLKTTKINPVYNTFIESCEYTYEGELLTKEVYKKSNGAEAKRYEYHYTNGILSSKDFYNDTEYTGTIKLAETTSYVFDNMGNELKNSTVKHLSDGSTREIDRKCYAYDAEGKLVSDSLYRQHLMAPILVPSAKHIYQYDKNGALVKVLEYGGDSDKSDLDKPGNFPMLSQYYVHTPQLYGSDYAPQNVNIQQGEAIGTIKITFKAPTVTTGLEGYKVMVDNELLNEIFTGTELTVKKQKKGTHVYRIFPIYNKEVANASDPVTFNIEIDCPPVTNLQVAAYEYYSYEWHLNLQWDAPAKNSLTFKNYRYIVDTSKGTSVFNTAAASTYSKKEETIITVYAVYEEGESDPCTITFDLSDITKSKVAHWNNSGYTVKDAYGNIKGSGNYYYKEYSGSEQLLFEVEYDAQNNPLRKTVKAAPSSYSKISVDTQYGWNKEEWTWKRDGTITSTSNMHYQVVEKRTKTIGQSGKLEDSSKETYTYATENTQDKLPIQTEYWTIAGKDSSIVSIKKHSYEGNGRVDMVYKADGETITGKEEYFYLDPAKVDSIKVYTYDGTNYTPTARTVFDYLSGTKLVSAEKTDKYTGGKWVKETEKVYTASSAYHKSHAVSELAAEEGDNLVKLTWKAPEGADGLSGYKVYANDVLCKKTPVPASATSYDVKGLPTGNFTFSIVAVYTDNQEANYVSTIGINHTDMTVAYDNLKNMIAAGVSAKGYSYRVTGEILVTGVLDPKAFGENYFVGDATGAVNVVPADNDDAAAFTFRSGDKIKSLKGQLKEENGTHYFIYESAELVSRNNNVTPTVMTIEDFVKNPSSMEAKYIKFEKVTFSDEVSADDKLLPAVCHMVQGDKSANLMLGNSQIKKPDAANVAGFVIKAEDTWALVLNGTRDFYAIYTPKEFANLKEMLNAGVDEDGRAYIVKGEILVTGAVASFIQTNYFVKDATAALCLSADEMSQFSVKAGDKIKDLKGTLDEFNGAHSFFVESATQVSTGNTVTPEVLTIATLNANPGDYEAQYVKFEEVTFNGVSGETTFPAITEMAQGNSTVSLIFGQEQINVVECANVSGFVSLVGGETQILLNGKEGFEQASGITDIIVSDVYYENGTIVAEGASSITVFDMTGRQLVYSASERADIAAAYSGIVAAKVAYTNGNVRIVKLIVK